MLLFFTQYQEFAYSSYSSYHALYCPDSTSSSTISLILSVSSFSPFGMPILVPSVSLSTANRKLLATATPGLASAYQSCSSHSGCRHICFSFLDHQETSVVADTRFSSLYAGTCFVTIASCSDPLWITITASARDAASGYLSTSSSLTRSPSHPLHHQNNSHWINS